VTLRLTTDQEEDRCEHQELPDGDRPRPKGRVTTKNASAKKAAVTSEKLVATEPAFRPIYRQVEG
jgi:hypothetical protein